MTSREALERVKHFISCNHPQESVCLCDTEEYKEIEKDLKVLEDIKKDLGIDLATLFKALKNGFYTKTTGLGNKNWDEPIITKIRTPNLKLNHITHKLCFERKAHRFSISTYEFEDYGKAWALTKEELKDN